MAITGFTSWGLVVLLLIVTLGMIFVGLVAILGFIEQPYIEPYIESDITFSRRRYTYFPGEVYLLSGMKYIFSEISVVLHWSWTP